MPEGSLSHAPDTEHGTAVRVGTGDFGIGRHPVAGISLALLRRKERQQGRQRIDRKRLSRRKRQILARDLEVVTDLVMADHARSACNYLDAQVIEREFIFSLAHSTVLGALLSRRRTT